ncbi:methyltransferase, TIGR04325 family [Variovorax sp. YR216]|uniref:methyltransferase, TIGR04325 family n=1 Tax=Variovorax sp. YR216 TaxID=1882828 RepID=UPI0015A4A8DB|nr:methyltransferase, TIGR04325 family [Variovorax sp. YR216]
MLLQWKREHFLSSQGYGFYYGVFESFRDARAWLPPSKEFDHAPIAEEFVEVRTKRVFAYDYPVLLWLLRALQAGATSVLDIGGSVGVHYYAYRRYIQLPEGLTWRVVEVPTMVAIGRNLAMTSAATALSFTEDLDQAVMASTSDIWISAGALQYVEDARPARLLKLCVARPKHILLNKLPLHSGDDFVTTQNIGSGSFAPVRVFNRGRFIEEIEECGYTLWDKWDVPERALYLPGFPGRSFQSFSGLYFVDSQQLRNRTTPPPYRGL